MPRIEHSNNDATDMTTHSEIHVIPDDSTPSSPLKGDITASVVVFLVALPLCLGIALASGAPLFSGLLAGIIGGIVVGSISWTAPSLMPETL